MSRYEQITYTYCDGSQAESVCITRGVHDAILRAKAQTQSQPAGAGSRAYVRTCIGGPDFLLYVVHSYLFGQSSETQQSTWEVFMFSSFEPMTQEQMSQAKIMVNALAGALSAQLKKHLGPDGHQEDILVERPANRLG